MSEPTSGTTAVAPAQALTALSTHVPLRDIAVAPENARASEEADEDIPGLAETIRAVGVLVPILARAGSKRDEKPAMALDGRRRLLALQLLLSEGAVTEDYPVPVIYFEGRINQAAAVVVANDERVAIHVANVITAIGRLRKRRCSTSEIAKALAYEEVEIRRLMALSDLHPLALRALRQDDIDLQTARLLARIKDKAVQKSLAEQALRNINIGYAVRQQLDRHRVDLSDPRFSFVGAERYRAAGGRVESDLFGELPDRLLDPQILTQAWRERIQAVVERFEADGLEVLVTDGPRAAAPEAKQSLQEIYTYSLAEPARAAVRAAEQAYQAEVDLFQALDPGSDAAIAALYAVLRARAERLKACNPGFVISTVALYPGRLYGAAIEVFGVRGPEDRDEDREDDEGGETRTTEEIMAPSSRRYEPVQVPKLDVEIAGGHKLLEAQTDVATRGLIRDLADSPVQAITVLTAQLFKGLVLKGQQTTDDASALQVRATAYSRVDVGPIAALDGEVLGRLERRKEEYMASGLRPIPWVAGMTMGEQTHLLAELVAISLNVRESRTYSLRRNARVEAAEISDLIGSDIAQHWTPDASYLAVHGKKQLMAMLEEMGSDDARAGSLRKDDLVTFTAEAAAARGFAPKVLSWSLPAKPPAESDDPNLVDDDTGVANPHDGTAEEDAAHPAEAPNGMEAAESTRLLAA